MSHFRLLSLATVGIGGYLYQNITNSRLSNVFKVNAQPKSTYGSGCYHGELKDINTFKQDLAKLKHTRKNPLTSSPTKPPTWTCAFEGESKPHQHISPTFSALKGKVFDISNNDETGLPDWTVEVVTKGRFKKTPKCIHRGVRPDDPCELEERSKRDASFHAGTVPPFESYCSFDLDPCFFQLAIPRTNNIIRPNMRIWIEFYRLVKKLNEDYNHVYICSGVVWKENPEIAVEQITHFYKVVVAQNRNGSYVFMCFLFENIIDSYAQINDVCVPRLKLEKEIGFKIFADIDSKKIKKSYPGWSYLSCAIQ